MFAVGSISTSVSIVARSPGEVDDQLRPIHPPAAILAVDPNRQRHQAVAVQLQRPLVIAVALDRDGRADARPAQVEIELEPDLGNQPVRRAIILAADGDMGRRGRRFGNRLGVGQSGADIGHKRAALGATG